RFRPRFAIPSRPSGGARCSSRTVGAQDRGHQPGARRSHADPAGGGRARVRALLAVGLRSLFEPPQALAALPDDPVAAQHAVGTGLDPRTVLRGLAAAERMRRHAEELNRRFGVFVHSGSNSWLVAPERSATGNALLWGGPQEGFDNPNID